MELRFNRTIRLLTSFVYTLHWVLNLPIIIYGPTLALNQVTGVNMQFIPPVVCIICIIYTTLGGLKAVVWADTFQGIIMLCSTLAIIILGLHKIGGFSEVIKTAAEGGRIEGLSTEFDPTIRLTLWSIFLGGFFLKMGLFGANPTAFQRYLSMPTLKQAQICAFVLCLGYGITVLLTTLIGLLMYSEYRGCDPLTAKMVQRPDQLFPLYVMDVSKNLRGIPGLFLAGIISAALSTMSSGLNTISGTIYKDFVEPWFSVNPTEYKANLIMRSIVIIIGCICLGLVFVVDKLGSILQVTVMYVGSTNGIMAAIFTLGMFMPFVNAIGTLCGTIASFVLMSWICIGSFTATANGLIKDPTKSLSMEMCNNQTTLSMPITE